jgi:catechol 2,3-dioxygenase-like lactoylglutathione lyase family enzyme
VQSRFHHAAISTPDLDRALGFYRDLLGFETVAEWTWPRGLRVADEVMGLEDSAGKAVMLRLGDVRLEVFEFASPTARPSDPMRPVCDHGITHLCIQVENLQDEYDRLNRAGVSFHCPPRKVGPGTIATYSRDPDGNVVELLEERPR